jgi:MFS family permease
LKPQWLLAPLGWSSIATHIYTAIDTLLTCHCVVLALLLITVHCVFCLQSMLGQVDLAFLAAYAAGMFFAGHMGDRTDLRVFLSIGMLGSGIFCCLFGMVSSSSSSSSGHARSMPCSKLKRCICSKLQSCA